MKEKHVYQSSVDLSIQPIFGAACSCGKIHSAEIINGAVHMQTETTWNAKLGHISSPPKDRRSHWGMTKM